VKTGISKANSLALLGLNTPEAPRGCRLPRSRGVELQNANSFALWHPDGLLPEWDNPMRGSTSNQGFRNANSFALLAITQLMSTPELREGADSHEAAMLDCRTQTVLRSSDGTIPKLYEGGTIAQSHLHFIRQPEPFGILRSVKWPEMTLTLRICE
jgi:hypothetical protein